MNIKTDAEAVAMEQDEQVRRTQVATENKLAMETFKEVEAGVIDSKYIYDMICYVQRLRNVIQPLVSLANEYEAKIKRAFGKDSPQYLASVDPSKIIFTDNNGIPVTLKHCLEARELSVK